MIVRTMKRIPPRNLPLWLIVGLLALLSPLAVRAQTASGSLILVTPAAVVDDRVSVDLLIRSAGLQRYDLLNTANFSIGEPAAAVQVSSAPSAPLTTLVMVNLGSASDADLIRATLRAYFDTYYRPEDQVILYVFGPNLLETFEPADLSTLQSQIDGLTASSLYAPIGSMFTTAQERLQTELAQHPTRAFQALFVGSYLIANDDPLVGQGFAALGVPLHVIQAHRFRDDSTEKLRALATNGGGLFVNNRGGRFLQDGTAVSTLALAYEALESSRSIYTLSYRPQRRDLTTEPEVTLTVQLTAQQQVSTSYTYARTFAPPQVELAQAALELRRTPSRSAAGVVFDVSEHQLTARVVFSDNVTRSIQSIQVELRSAADDQVLLSELDLDPDVDALGNFDVTLPLTAFDQPDSTTAFRLVVTVTDELGLSGAAEAEGRLLVAALPPLPTLTPEPTQPPTATAPPAPTATVPAAAPISAVPQTITGSDNRLILLFAGIILFLVLVIAVMLVRLRRISRAARLRSGAAADDQEFITDAGQPDPPTKQPATTPTASPTPPAPATNKLLGRLIVIKGLKELEIPITRDEFVIGRDSTGGCDYVIAEPYISPRHCMIIHRNGRFAIRDLKAKNGVFVNGERIPIERDVVVPIGSEVSITQNIVVELWDPTTVVNRNTTRMGSTVTQTQHSQVTGTEHLFRPMLGIRYVDDDEEVGDDYSPL